MTPQRRRRRIVGPVESRIRNLAVGGYSPAQIEKALHANAHKVGADLPLPTDAWTVADIPTLRTIQRIVAEIPVASRSTPPTEVWSVRDSDPDEARHVLPVLGGLVMWSDFRRTSITKDEAGWITRISRVAPGFDPVEKYAMAMVYLQAERAGRSSRGLDVLVAWLVRLQQLDPESTPEDRAEHFAKKLAGAGPDNVAIEVLADLAIDLAGLNAMDLKLGSVLPTEVAEMGADALEALGRDAPEDVLKRVDFYVGRAQAQAHLARVLNIEAESRSQNEPAVEAARPRKKARSDKTQ